MKTLAELLTTGLASGYAGKTTMEKIDRGGFCFKSSHIEGEGEVYHDEWLDARVGGGQEVVMVGDQKMTRIYAGGVVAEQTLVGLGITKKEVIGALKESIGKLGDKTRLFGDCGPIVFGNWTYSYQITDRIESVELTRALEVIRYKGVEVFVHSFEICLVV